MKSPILSSAITLMPLLIALSAVHAGSATWKLDPGSNDWNKASNWTPRTIPNSPEDVATFDLTTMTLPVIHSDIEVNTLLFAETALPQMTITVGDASSEAVVSLTLSGTGIVNNTDYFLLYPQAVQAAPTLAANGARNIIYLKNDAGVTTGGDHTFTQLIAQGGTSSNLVGGQIKFLDNSNASKPGWFTGVIAQSGENGGGGGEIWFFDNSSAGDADVENWPSDTASTAGTTFFMGTSTADSAYIGNSPALTPDGGGKTFFLESSTAGDSILYAGAGASVNAGGGTVIFSDNASAGNSLLAGYGGQSGGLDGSFQFLSNSIGGTAQVELTRSGNLIISDHNPPGITIGSLSDGSTGGKGIVILGSNNLTVGSNNLTTDFSGVIKGSGSLTKVGSGKLTLRGTSTYTGLTTVAAGTLNVRNKVGSATGTGAVSVQGGIFGGSGIVAGPVTVEAGGVLTPTLKNRWQQRLTIQNALTFETGSTYSCGFHFATSPYAEVVVADGIVVANGTHFQARADKSGTLPLGTTFVVIDNTSVKPIHGTFENLPDGSIVIVRGNKLQASYSGGDGNDLTLTVVP